MPILDWKDEFSIGVAEIDAEHKQIVQIINQAHDSVDTLADSTAVKRLLSSMAAYAENHFATEERFMQDYDYPAAKVHVGEHKAFLAKLNAADTDFAGDRLVPGTVKILSFLADWLVYHIMETDKHLGEYLQNEGVN